MKASTTDYHKTHEPKSIKDTIVTGEEPGKPKTRMACGCNDCPFYQTLRPTSPADSITLCTLPGDGANMLDKAPYWSDESRYFEVDDTLYVKRLPKCLEVKPIHKQRKEKYAKSTKRRNL